MDPVGKALWFIESHFAGEIALDEIADVSGVSLGAVTFGPNVKHDLHSIRFYGIGFRLIPFVGTAVSGSSGQGCLG